MQCKLFHVDGTTPGPRLPLGYASSRILVLVLALAVLTSARPVQAQEFAPKAADAPKEANASRTGGVISGIAYLPGGNQPATQVAVTLKSHDAGIFRSVLTEYNGHFEFQDLPSGTYDVSIEEQGYGPYRSTAQFDGSSLKLELHLATLSGPQPPANAYTISARELKIPSNAHNEYNKGLESLAKKDENGSLNHFMKAVKLFPGYFEAFYHQGIVHINLGQLEKAMQEFQKAVILSGGRYAKAVFGIGYLHYLQGDPAEAETTVRRGLEIDPNAADGYVILGMTLLHLNRPEEAEQSAREALARDPNMANAYLVLADCNARQKNYREQIQDLDIYLRLDPNGQASQRARDVRAVAQRIMDRMPPQN